MAGKRWRGSSTAATVAQLHGWRHAVHKPDVVLLGAAGAIHVDLGEVRVGGDRWSGWAKPCRANLRSSQNAPSDHAVRVCKQPPVVVAGNDVALDQDTAADGEQIGCVRLRFFAVALGIVRRPASRMRNERSLACRSRSGAPVPSDPTRRGSSPSRISVTTASGPGRQLARLRGARGAPADPRQPAARWTALIARALFYR